MTRRPNRADILNDEYSPAMRRSKKMRKTPRSAHSAGPTVGSSVKATILILADESRAIEHLPPRVARRRPVPTTLLRRQNDEFHGDVRGTMGL